MTEWKRDGGALMSASVPGCAGTATRGEMKARSYAAGRNWESLGKLSNGVVRRLRYMKARH